MAISMQALKLLRGNGMLPPARPKAASAGIVDAYQKQMADTETLAAQTAGPDRYQGLVDQGFEPNRKHGRLFNAFKYAQEADTGVFERNLATRSQRVAQAMQERRLKQQEIKDIADLHLAERKAGLEEYESQAQDFHRRLLESNAERTSRAQIEADQLRAQREQQQMQQSAQLFPLQMQGAQRDLQKPFFAPPNLYEQNRGRMVGLGIDAYQRGEIPYTAIDGSASGYGAEGAMDPFKSFKTTSEIDDRLLALDSHIAALSKPPTGWFGGAQPVTLYEGANDQRGREIPPEQIAGTLQRLQQERAQLMQLRQSYAQGADPTMGRTSRVAGMMAGGGQQAPPPQIAPQGAPMQQGVRPGPGDMDRYPTPSPQELAQASYPQRVFFQILMENPGFTNAQAKALTQQKLALESGQGQGLRPPLGAALPFTGKQ